MVRKLLSVFATLLCLAFLSVAPALAEGEPVWAPVAEAVAAEIDKAEKLYAEGDVKAANKAVINAYFGVFESTKMEAAMRTQIGAKHTYLVERQFGTLRKAMKKGESAEAVGKLADELRHSMRRDAKVLDEAGIPAAVFEVNK